MQELLMCFHLSEGLVAQRTASINQARGLKTLNGNIRIGKTGK
jgi:hypothetical protein